MKLRNKFLVEYREGASQFLEVAKFHVDDYSRIGCPCKRCMNSNWDSFRGCGATSINNWNIPLLYRMRVMESQ